MSPNALDLVWWGSDVEQPAFTAAEIGAWPERAFDALSACGLLREWRTASHVVCGACSGGHVAEVSRLSYPDSAVRFFANCPEHGRVHVEEGQLRQWTVDFEPVLECVARDLGAAGAAFEVVPARLWNVGVAKLAGRSRPVWVGRGLSWPDASPVAGKLPAGALPVLLHLGRPPQPGVTGLGPAAVIDAARVLSVADGAIALDRRGVEEQLAARQPATRRKAPPKRATRQTAMAALKTALREHLVAARDHAYAMLDRDQEPQLLPRPTQKLLARQLHLSRSAVCRALADGSDKELLILWEAASQLEQVMRAKDP